ncbi:MAG: 50S ribosomal protein L23 [Candidatus Paceibacterota bacterium]
MKNQSTIIKNPRVTEKASAIFEKNVYTFDVLDSATKSDIKKAIFALFKVNPVKVNVVSIPKQMTSYRGRKSMKEGGKKAYVYLKEGDKIEL